jgi:hypothetical protein
MAEGYTREQLALHLINAIAGAEGKDIAKADREYTLDLVKEVVAAIDGGRKADLKIAPGQR